VQDDGDGRKQDAMPLLTPPEGKDFTRVHNPIPNAKQISALFDLNRGSTKRDSEMMISRY
jgi:hypothetical protein